MGQTTLSRLQRPASTGMNESAGATSSHQVLVVISPFSPAPDQPFWSGSPPMTEIAPDPHIGGADSGFGHPSEAGAGAVASGG
jgi:hypothetical protein